QMTWPVQPDGSCGILPFRTSRIEPRRASMTRYLSAALRIRRSGSIRIFWLAILISVAGLAVFAMTDRRTPESDATSTYIAELDLGEMRCGHVNRVAVDLFQAMGFRGRLVQAACHILAEICYDDAWHYFDGDIFGNGECVVRDDGHIPSMNELAECAERLDALT